MKRAQHMTLSANQSAMAFQKTQDQKIDQHQQPKVELGNKVKKKLRSKQSKNSL